MFFWVHLGRLVHRAHPSGLSLDPVVGVLREVVRAGDVHLDSFAARCGDYDLVVADFEYRFAHLDRSREATGIQDALLVTVDGGETA